MRRTVSFNDLILTNYFIMERVTRSILPPREIGLLSVPGRHGAYFKGARYGVRVITFDVTVVAKTPTEYMDTLRTLAYCLDIEEPAEMIISDEPDKIYFAILSGDTDMVNQLLTFGKGSLTFLCPDPFAYSSTPKIITPVDRLFTLENKGTTTTFPKFKVNFQNEATFVSMVSPDGVILIGNPNEPDKIVLPREQYILNNPMTSTSGWENAGNSYDAGRANTGSIGVKDVDGIVATDYGPGTTGAKMWHGPAIRRDLSQEVTDFTVKARLNFRSEDGTSALDGNQMGRLEIYLFDKNGFKLGKLSMRDSFSNYEFNIPEIFVQNTTFLEKEPTAPKSKKVSQKQYKTYIVKKGDTLTAIAKKYNMKVADLAIMNHMRISDILKIGRKLKVYDKTVVKMVYPTHVGDYNDFFGELTLSRVGDKFYAEVSRIDTLKNWKKYKTIKKTSYDRGKSFSRNPLSYIVIHFLQYDTSPVVRYMRVTDIKVLKHNTDTVIEIPAIFQPGDELEVDLSDESVYLNGEEFLNEIDVGSDFFAVPEGLTEVKVNTDDPSATFEAEFTERWL